MSINNKTWCSDSLHDLVGYSDSALSSYLVNVATKAKSYHSILNILEEGGVQPLDVQNNDKQSILIKFAQDLFTKCRSSQQKQKTKKEGMTHADMIRKAATYQLVDDSDEEIIPQIKKLPKTKDKKKHLRRRRSYSTDSESQQSVYKKEKKSKDSHKRQNRKMKSNLTESERMEIDREMDLKERDEFVKRLNSRDKKQTKSRHKSKKSYKRGRYDSSSDTNHSDDSDDSHSSSKTKPKKSISHEDEYNEENIEKMREESRRVYLKTREEKELTLLEQAIQDEEELFGKDYLNQLTSAEKKKLALNRQILAMARKRQADGEFEMEAEGDAIMNANRDGIYRLPDDLDEHQTKAQQSSKLLSSRYVEKKVELSEQELWEQAQKSRVQYGFGGKKKRRNDSDKKDEKKYDFVFDNQIDFVMQDTTKGYDNTEYNKRKSDFLDSYKDNVKKTDLVKKISYLESAREKMKETRSKLPVYPYREEFLAAVKDHQVLILVGETGSGKTTQIPQYLHEVGYSELGKIGCTQPRRVAAMSVAARVASEMGCKLGHQVGYSIRFENCTNKDTVIQYMTDGMLLREFLAEPDLKSYSCLVIDEAHERTLHTDILFGLVKDIVRFRDDLRLVISSATLDAEKFSRYFDDASIFMIPGRMYPVDIFYTKAPEADYVDAAVVTVLQIHVSQPTDGDILVFLTGQEEIETAAEILTQRTKNLGSKIKDLIVCPIYANLPSEQQAKIFEKTPRDARKVVLATNIAETSLTIDGICYVIDTGFNKEKSYNARSGMESLMVTPISQAAAKQRSGRAGRTQPGKCFRLFTAYSFENELDPTTTPEIMRTNMANVVLMLKSLGINDLLNFDFMDAPPADALIRALEQLYALGGLNDRGELTKLGRKMAEFPLDPMLSKSVIASEQYKCVSEVLSTVSMLSIGASIFYRPKEKAVHADTARLNFARGGGGDHISLLRCYTEWADTEYSSQWCFEHYIQVKSMRKARDIREQLEGLCERVEVDKDLSLNPDEGGMDDILKAITSGFFYNTAKLGKSGDYQTIKQRRTVYIHPSSVLAKEEEAPGWLLYFELAFTSKEFMRQVAPIKPNWLIEIAPHFYQESDVEDSKTKKMPKSRKYKN